MPPPRQDAIVERVYGDYNILKYCITKAGGLYLEGRKVGRYEGRPFTVKGLFSNCQSLPTCCDRTNSCKTQMADGTATFPRNDIESLCKTQVAGAAATLPQRGEGRSNYNLIKDDNQPSHQPIGEGARHGSSGTLKSLVKNCDRGLYFFKKIIYNDVMHHNIKYLNRERDTHVVASDNIRRAAFTLAEGATHVVHFDDIRRAAFTLAEVLITLGIIGVVAALTMPSLIAHYKDKVFITSAKRSYSIVTNAFNKWNTDNGVIGDYTYFWTNFPNSDETTKELAKELNAVAICTNSKVDACGGEYDVKYAQKTNDGNGNTKTLYFINSRRIVLADGTFVAAQNEAKNGACTHQYFAPETDADGNYIKDPSSPTGNKGEYKTSNNCGFIHIDTNGLKGPNQIGKDYFIIGVSENKGFYSNSDKYGNLEYVLANDKLIETEKYNIGEY